jgi:hypothetical protein
MPNNIPNTKMVFIGGTVVSLLVAVLSGFFFDAKIGFQIGLIAEVLTSVSVLWVRVSEVEITISDDISRVLDLANLYRKVAELDDPLFTEKYKQLIWNLGELSEGRYDLLTIEQVYEDDTRSIDMMQSNETLRSICPIARDSDAAIQQISNKSYLASIKSHIDAANKGVRVIRIYALLDNELFNVNELRSHFDELVTQKVEVYLVFHGDPKFRLTQTIDLDFLIFGDRKVSIGKIDPRTEVVSGSHVETNHTTVEKYTRDYNTLLRIADRYVPGQSFGEPQVRHILNEAVDNITNKSTP